MDFNACFLLTRFITPPVSRALIDVGMRMAMTSHSHLTPARRHAMKRLTELLMPTALFVARFALYVFTVATIHV